LESKGERLIFDRVCLVFRSVSPSMH
jgi:hypothetical protein